MRPLFTPTINHSSSTRGLTLIEVLIVIVVLGIVLAFVIPVLSDPNANIKEAQAAFTQATDRARGLVRRFSTDYRLEITNGGNSFRYYPVDRNNNAVTGLTEIRQKLPNNVILEGVINTDLSKPIFLGPFGRVQRGAAEQCFKISAPTAPKQAAVSLVGVTGKVIPRGLTTTACQ
jgi:prepilin-type N-terminal cleavage/methylation domain-containing protein